jgi:predicted MPP superfamily phosphohydrolase
MIKKIFNMLGAPAPPSGARATPKGRLAHWVGRHWAHLTYAVRVEPTWLEVNRLEVPIRDLPRSFEGMTIVQMSDFHGGRFVTSEYLDEAVALTHQQSPDAIVLTGDFIHKGQTHVDRVARALGRLRAPAGVFAVLGNHDFSVRNALGVRRYKDLHQHVADALVREGIRVLRNETVTLSRGGTSLHLAGLEDLWSRMCDADAALAHLPENEARVVLALNPLSIERLGRLRCDLMLSGHTHGGQVKVPGLGRIALGPGGRRFAAGLYRVHQSWLYVNTGIGVGLPVRYNVRPEVAVFTLVSEKPS